eukprot:scaffold338_cov377-Prasinococcus_capsulatus_cf.AAC.2
MDRLAASGLLQKLRESREQQKQEELRQRHHQLELQAQNLVKNPGVTAQQAQPQIRVEPDQLTAFLNELQARPGMRDSAHKSQGLCSDRARLKLAMLTNGVALSSPGSSESNGTDLDTAAAAASYASAWSDWVGDQ